MKDVMNVLMSIFHWCQTPTGNQVLELALAMLLAYLKLHLDVARQQEVGKAVQWAVKGLETGHFDMKGALNYILGTGKVPESKATAIVEAVINKTPATVAPTKGVSVTIAPDGKVSVDPSGFVANKTHKISKWLKKVF